MKRCAIIVGLGLVAGNRLWAQDNDPTCTWGPWQAVTAPGVQFIPPVIEPATAGEQTSVTVQFYGVPGTKERYDDCGNHQIATWPDSVSQRRWVTSDSSGPATNSCSTYWTATFTTPSQGGVTFFVHLSATSPTWQTSPDPFFNVSLNTLPHTRLGYWRFDSSGWTGEQGQSPIAANNVQNVQNWNRGALKLDSSNPALLSYHAYESDGWFNITRAQGTIRFWFKPNWSTGTAPGYGPGSQARLLQMYENNTVVWALTFNQEGSGTGITLATFSDICIQPKTHFLRAINWDSTHWHQIVVTYSPAATDLYIDGSPLRNGSPAGVSGDGVVLVQNAATSFSIGSDIDGTSQARGLFDELETFNYPLSPSAIQQNYNSMLALDSDGDGLSNLQEVQSQPPNGPTDPFNADTDGDGVPDGIDCFPLDPNKWDCGDPNDMTPPVIQLLQPINATPFP